MPRLLFLAIVVLLKNCSQQAMPAPSSIAVCSLSARPSAVDLPCSRAHRENSADPRLPRLQFAGAARELGVTFADVVDSTEGQADEVPQVARDVQREVPPGFGIPACGAHGDSSSGYASIERRTPPSSRSRTVLMADRSIVVLSMGQSGQEKPARAMSCGL